MPLSVKSSSRWRKSEADRILTLANWNDATNFDTVYVHKIEGTYSISGTFKPGTRYKFIELGGLALFIPIYFSIEGTITIPYTSGTSGYNVGISVIGSMTYPELLDTTPLFISDISLTRETGDISINICFSSKCNYILVTSGNAGVDRYNHYIYTYTASITDLTIHPYAYYSNPSFTQLDRINVNITGKLAAIAVTEYDKLSITEYSTPTPLSPPGMAMSAPLTASAGVSLPVRGPPGWGNTLPSGRQKPPGAKP
ncbi:MAG: hypothetical protein ACPL4I_10985 [Bacteroidota bacterium]